MTSIELVYFSGCPNVEVARTNLRAALDRARIPTRWTEWDQLDARAPKRVQCYGSPTILVDGRDVTGVGPSDAFACRATGAPSVEHILVAIGRPA